MTAEKHQSSYPKRIARILLKVVLFLVLFVVLIFLLLLTPPVQKFMTSKVENYLENKLKTRVDIGRIGFGLSGKVNLLNVYIEDRNKDTLIYGGAIRSHINFLKLFSNEVQIKDIELQNITAKIKRVLPDTVFNYQFIVDAFMADQTKQPDTAATAPMKLKISDISLENVRLTYIDAVTGNDIFARFGNLSATIDTLDPEGARFSIPTVIGRNIEARVKQSKPLVTPEPLSKDLAEASTAVPMHISVGTVDLSRTNIDFANDVSGFYTKLNLGELKAKSRLIDMQNNRIYFSNLTLNNSSTAIRLAKKEGARVVKEEVKQEVEAQKQQGWDFRIDNARINGTNLQYDDDNLPKLRYGMDFAHLQGNDLTLHVDNFVMKPDSIAGHFIKGSVREKSGFALQRLEGEMLYANKQAYLKNLYIKTPGSEIKRSLVLEYASLEALTKNFAQTVLDLDLVDSRLQVKDILLFAPQLRSNPAFSNPSDVWYVNIVGSGTLNRLNFESLRFNGLKNTEINAEGTLVGLMQPTEASGRFTIHRLRTSQTDIALFTGARLSNAQLNLPEIFDINGTVDGNAGRLQTALTLRSTAGLVAMNGTFANMTKPNAASYTATVRTSGLKLGGILRQPDQIGALSGDFYVNGTGLTPQTMQARYRANVRSVGYNNYTYRNINVAGNYSSDKITADADVNDPNIDLNFTASYMAKSGSFSVDGMIDSVKTLPLNFTTEPMIFRGAISGDVRNLNPDYLDANVMITNALLISNNERIPLDTVHLVSGRTDTANYLRLNSDLVNASINGQYRFSDLGKIMQSTIEPYFSVAPTAAQRPKVQPYNFRFTLDAVYNPVYSSFLPGLTAMEPLHAEGSFETNAGMQASATTSRISFNGNDMSDLSLRANTTDQGLQITSNIARLKSGSLDVFNTRVNATALNNVIDFKLGVDDAQAKNKYLLSGVIRQPSNGQFALQLKPDSLMLNYDLWSVPADNQITFGKSITANNFTLERAGQRLSIASLPGAGTQPLEVTFSNFKLGTLTGFVKADTVIADGLINGSITFQDLTQQPVFTSNLTISDLSMKQDTIGNLNLQVKTGEGNRYITSASITGRGNDVSLTGSFAPSGKAVDLNLDLDMRQLQMKSFEGAMSSFLSNPSGAMNGTVRIRGNTTSPSVRGTINFDTTSFALKMLGSQFTIDKEQLSITENGLTFDRFTLRDSANNPLTINGQILSSNFINYNFNLDVRARNFLAMNSTKQQNKLYYGRLNVSSNMHIGGTELKPVVDGSVTVNEGTNLSVVVPQKEPGVQQREGVVQFVDMDAPENDSLFLAQVADTLNQTGILGMDIAANIEVKKEAILNVIIDEANGDLLNVQGEALLSGGIDPSGKMTMVGNYTLTRGSYEISFNFLRRKFDIREGSTITWTGEPTAAQLDLTAVYVANTSPIDLVEDQIAASTPAIRNTYLQKLPFEVHLSLTGELMKPVIDFDILLPEARNYGVSNDIVTLVQGRLAQLRQNEGDINKQVFSLLLLGRFVNENPFESSGGGFSAGAYARQSVSKLLTEQLNDLAANIIEGVDINFDVQSSEDYTTGERRNRTDLNVGLSKQLLNDRLKVTVGNNFALEGPQNSNQRNNNIAGNIALDYQLSRDGRYMVRFFRRNQYEGVVDGYIIENGVSFILSVDFNRLSEILKGKKQRVNRERTQNR